MTLTKQFLAIIIPVWSIGGGAFSRISTSAFSAPSIVRNRDTSRARTTFPHTVTPIHPISSTSTAVSALPALSPSLGSFAAATIIPASLGLWRAGYAVTVGYGAAMLASGTLQLKANLSSSAILTAHSLLYICYGARLCLFLLKRGLSGMVTAKDATLMERLKRLPLILGISSLYFCMAAAPLRISAYTMTAGDVESVAEQISSLPKIVTIGVGFGGFLIAAVGDWYKSKIKARDGPNKLVTTGPYRYLRHPNYTGEMLGWTCTCLILPILQTISYSKIGTTVRPLLPWLASSALGWFGICFPVLAWEATTGLEKKQREKYGGTPEYEKWIQSSWSGPMF